MHARTRSLWILAMLAIVSAGCASVETEVAVERDVCCGTDLGQYQTFLIESDSLPEFLRPYFVEELATVLLGKGLREADPGDLHISLRYERGDLGGARPVNIAVDTGEQVRTPRQREEPEGFKQSMGSETPVRFMARVMVEMRAADTDEIVWSGVLARGHTVSTGEYMHDRARAAIQLAFTRLLADFPERSVPDRD